MHCAIVSFIFITRQFIRMFDCITSRMVTARILWCSSCMDFQSVGTRGNTSWKPFLKLIGNDHSSYFIHFKLQSKFLLIGLLRLIWEDTGSQINRKGSTSTKHQSWWKMSVNWLLNLVHSLVSLYTRNGKYKRKSKSEIYKNTRQEQLRACGSRLGRSCRLAFCCHASGNVDPLHCSKYSASCYFPKIYFELLEADSYVMVCLLLKET